MSITITADSPTSFSDYGVSQCSAHRLTDTKFVVAYADSNDGDHLKAIVGTRSGYTPSISTSDAATIEGTNSCSFIKVERLDDTHFVVYYQDMDNSDAYACVCSVSGTTTTVGTPVQIQTSIVHVTGAVFDSSNFVVCYTKSDDKGYCKVCSVSGTTISAGSEQTVEATGRFETSTNVHKRNFVAVGLDADDFVLVGVNNNDSRDLTKYVINADTSAQTISAGTADTDPEGCTVFTCVEAPDDSHVLFFGESTAGTDVVVVKYSVDKSAKTFGNRVQQSLQTTVNPDNQNTDFAIFWGTGMGSGKYCVAVRDVADSSKGKVMCGTYATGTIADDDIATFETDGTETVGVCRMTDDYFLVFYNEPS